MYSRSTDTTRKTRVWPWWQRCYPSKPLTPWLRQKPGTGPISPCSGDVFNLASNWYHLLSEWHHCSHGRGDGDQMVTSHSWAFLVFTNHSCGFLLAYLADCWGSSSWSADIKMFFIAFSFQYNCHRINQCLALIDSTGSVAPSYCK